MNPIKNVFTACEGSEKRYSSEWKWWSDENETKLEVWGRDSSWSFTNVRASEPCEPCEPRDKPCEPWLRAMRAKKRAMRVMAASHASHDCESACESQLLKANRFKMGA